MKKRFNEKLLQKGGMMIEALAMLGLIAVVTPTMYKKSAERTLEVEDINTATTMRSVMTAADSYLSSHYGELIQQIPSNAEGVGYKTINISKLKPYLPYSFNEDKLYDFNAPKVAVARQGNNLTAFVLFPAKSGADDGLGHERTVRIATLVGANGGYVNTSENAKGIGGIWSLSKSNLDELFGSDSRNIYSIVTASSDAINNTNTEEDTDKFLYRTDQNGKWHNTMRSDLYLGGFIPTEDDAYIRSDEESAHNTRKNYSIRDVKRLIIGSKSVANYTGNWERQDDLDAAEIDEENANRKFGLYMKDSSSQGIDSAFIYGTLEAADSNLVVNNSSLSYSKPTTTGGLFHFKVDNGSLSYGTSGNFYNFKVSDNGVITNSNDIMLASVEPSSPEDTPIQKWSNVKIGRLGQGGGFSRYLINGNPNASADATTSGSGILSLIDSDTVQIKGKAKDSSSNYTVDYADRIVVNNNGTKGDGTNTLPTISYTTSPTYPVRFGSNVKVDGILATPQLDAQKLRVAEIEVGSAKIDDQNKWLKVDANGIHGRNPTRDATTGNTNTVFDVRDANINIATGSMAPNATPFNLTNGADNAISLVKDTGIELASKKKIDIYVDDDTNTDTSLPINLKNKVVQEQLKGENIVFSSLQTAGNETTNVKVKGTNLEVSDQGSNVVLSVKGNTSTSTSLDKYTRGAAGTDVANVAAHGEVLFTSSLVSGDADRQYMKIGSNVGSNAVVNIIQKDANNEFKKVLSVDGNASHSDDVDTTYTDSTNGGTVYIRKGMVDVQAPTTTYFADANGFNNTKTDAAHGYGVVKASRFVANNMSQTIGSETISPATFSGNFVVYGGGSGTSKAVASSNDYNGTGAVLYDTYMVNPAYTSVMHDIKLTTRGGARLSDILPDFINKGIYITNNTYKDSITKLHFAMGSDGISLASDAGTLAQGTGTINLGSSDSWASPYLGFVPAPQCPPGYNRLITLAPQSFMMSQAGQMQRGDHPRGNKAYYVKNQVPDDSAFTDYNQMISDSGAYVSQAFVNTVSATANTDVTTSGTVTGNGLDGEYSGSVTLKNVPLSVGASYTDVNGATQNPSGSDLYFMISTGDLTPPLTIQQSTWLKTNVIPVGSGATDAYIGHSSGGYTKGWAALMGFVYDKATYQTVIDRLGSEHSPIAYDNSGGSVYWNIFPVRRNTLEAYATTYCYFDRKGIMNTLSGSAGMYIDQYDALQDYKTNSWKKSEHGNYLKRLNDPTLKYNEIW